MSDDLNAEIKIGADASGVEAGVSKAKRSLKDLGDSAKRVGKDAGDGMGAVGDGGDKAAKKVESATRSMQNSLQRLLAEQQAGSKGSREYWEALADAKGVSRNSIKPVLDQIDAAKAKTLAAQDAADSWKSSLGKLGPLVATVFSGAAITGFLGKVVSVQREFDVLNSSLKTVTGSSAAAEREMAWLKDFAKSTPFGLAQATEGFVKMKALGLDPTKAALTSFGNTASAMGKDLNQIIEAVADASTGEFERLKEFGIKASKEGGKVALTFQGVTTTIKNNSAEITKYLENIGNVSFGGAMEERAKTLDGTIAALGDTWDELFRTVSSQKTGSVIFDSVTLANGALEDATTILRALGGAADDAAQQSGAFASVQEGLAITFETVAVMAAQLAYVLKGVGREIGGWAAQLNALDIGLPELANPTLAAAKAAMALAKGQGAAVAQIHRDMQADAEAARKEVDATTERILGARSAMAEYNRYATRNASAATDPRRVDLPKPRATSDAKSGKDAKEIKAYNQELEQQKSLIAELSGLSSSFYKDWDSLNKQYAQGRISIKGLEEAQAALLAKQPAMVALAKEEAEVSKARLKAWEDEVKGWQKQVEERNKAAESAEDALLKAREEERAHALAAAANITLAEAVARLTLARAEDNYQKALSKGSDGETLLALQRETDARRGLVEVMQQKGVREANEKAAEAISKEWEKTSQLIGDTLADYIMGGGKDAAQYLKRLFATLVLQPVVQYGVNSAMGALGIGQQGSAVQSVLAGGNVGSKVLNNAGAIGAGYQAIYGASVGASSASLLGANAVGLMGGDAIGTLAAANGMWAGVATSASQAAVAANLAMEAGTAAALEAGTLSAAASGAAASAGSLMSGFMAAAPWVAGAVALLSVIKGFDDSGTPHSGAGAVYSKATGVQSGVGIYNQSTFGMGHRDEYSEAMQAGISGIAQGLGQTLDAFAVSFGKTAGYSVATAFADDSSKDGSWGSLKIADELGQVLINWEDSRASKWAPREFADGEAGYKEYLNAVAVDVKNAFVAMDLPTWADQILATATDIDTLNAALQQISTAKSVFEGLGKTMSMFADLSGDLQTRLLAASGGIDALASNAGAFYESFYTEGERALKQRELQMAALAGMGLYIDPAEGDAAKAAFKKTVQDAMESGQVELAAQLLAMSGPFAATADYAQGVLTDMESAAKSAAEAAAQAAEDVAQAAADAAQAAADAAQAAAQAAAEAARAAAQAAAGAVSGAWANLGTASGWAAQHLGDSSGLQGQLGMVQASYQGATTVEGREAALGQIIALEQSIWQVEEQNRQATAQAAQKQAQALQGQLSAVNAILGATQRLREYAEGLFAGAASGLSDAERLDVLAAQYSTQLTLANGRDVDAMGKLPGVAGEYLALAQQLSGTQSDYSVLSGRIAAELAATAIVQGASAKTQADTLQAQIDAANSAAQYASKQFEVSAATKELIATQLKDAAKQFETEMTAMQAQLQTGMEANLLLEGLPAELTGVLNSTLVPVIGTIADAAMSAASMSAASAEAARQAAAAASAAASAAAAAAIAAASKEAMSAIPGFASGGSHLGGLRIVGERGPEVEATGPSRIWNQSQIASALGGNSNAALVEAVDRLTAQNARLEARLANIERSTEQFADQFDNITAGGNGMAVEVMT